MDRLHFKRLRIWRNFKTRIAINAVQIWICARNSQVVYFNGHLPVFTHDARDLASFRLFTSQLIINGTATQRLPDQIVRAFGVPLTTVKRYVKKYRQGGAKAFIAPPRPRHGHKLTAERLAQAQALLDAGESVPAVSAQIGVLAMTLHKAIDTGRLCQIKKKDSSAAGGGLSAPPSTKSQRSVEDEGAPLGVATTRSIERVAAAAGLLREAPMCPSAACCARCRRCWPSDCFTTRHTWENFTPPGEWGKLLGLDRVPEVKTLREKLGCATLLSVSVWATPSVRLRRDLAGCRDV